MVLDHRQHLLSPVRNVLSAVVAPIQYLVDKPIKLVSAIGTNFSSRQVLLAENAELHAQQMLLQAQLQKLIALENENTQLRALLTASERIRNMQVAVAQLLEVNTDPLMSEIVLDKGLKEEVYIGQPVLDAKGVMGQVIQVGSLTSRVLLLNDLRSAIPVQNSRSGIRGLVIGKGKLLDLELTDIPLTADVKVGDILVTSGLGGRYPAGYPVGMVKVIKHNPGEQFAQIIVTSTAKLNQSQQVLLIWPPNKLLVDAPKQSDRDKTNPKLKNIPKSNSKNA